MRRVFIEYISSFLPGERISNGCVEQKIKAGGFDIQEGLIEKIIGNKYRYYAENEEQVSDLCASAARKLLEKIPDRKIDLLIFAAASQDLIEPATANIVQHKLGLNCPAFDLKNACNSVTNAMEIASALILNGDYNNILVVCGEKISNSIRFHNIRKEDFKDHFAAYSLGDAGVALLLSSTTEDKGFFYHKQQSFGEYWELCRIQGGGSMFPGDASKHFFIGDTFGLKKVLLKLAPDFIINCIKEAGITVDDIDIICAHQVSKDTNKMLSEVLNCDIKKIVQTFHLYGNTAAATLPLALDYAYEKKMIKNGSIVMLVGMAAGINLSIQLMKA